MISTSGAHFSNDWLALRETIDHRSRAHELIPALDHYFAQCRPKIPQIVDLGAGRGSNLRYLSARLAGPLHWRALDNDPDLLARIQTPDPDQVTLTSQIFDMVEPLAPILAGADLVTASALLDLVSAKWITALCASCAAAHTALLIALTINGRMNFSNFNQHDDMVFGAFLHDQRRDKGMGLALGPDATEALVRALASHDYMVAIRESNWHLGYTETPLACALIDEWQQAAQRQLPHQNQTLADWAKRRKQDFQEGGTKLTVGHLDVLAMPESAEASFSLVPRI